MSNKNGSIKNFIWGIIGTVLTSIVAIIIPRLFIVNYGSEINGLLSSIKQIYVYLGLLEAGVGSASLQALYKPIAIKDYKKVNEILAATDYYYKRIGVLYFSAIIIMGFLYPLLLDTTIPYYVCFFVIVLQGMGSVINYLVQGKYVMLLNVDNRAYINNNICTITNIVTDFVRILFLLAGKSIIAIQSAYLIFSLVKMVLIYYYIKKNYSWLDLNCTPDFEAISEKNSVLVHQISSLIFSNTDVLIITFVCGLKTVSIYSIYASFFSIINNIITITSSSVQSAFGQLFNSNKERFLKIQEAYEVYFLALVFSLFTVTTIFIIPFLKLYTTGADINYVDPFIAILFCFFQLLNYGRTTSGQIITFAGEFTSTRWRAILEAVINLTVSLFMVFKLGIYGVLIGTIAALLYRANDMILFANHRILNRSSKPTYIRWIRNFLLFIVIMVCSRYINLDFTNYFSLILNAGLLFLVVVIIYFGTSTIFEKEARMIVKEFILSLKK